MTLLSHACALSPVSLPRAADAIDGRHFRRLTLFRLDDAVRDARRGEQAVAWLSKKNTPLPALARYRAEHPDLQIEVDEDKTRLRVSITLGRDTPVQ